MFRTTWEFHRSNRRMISVGAAVLLAGLAAGCADRQAAAPGHGTLIRHSAPRRAAHNEAQGVKGAIAPGALSCSGSGPVIGEVGILRAGEARAAKNMLGKFFRAQATDSVSGQIMFFVPPGSLNLKPFFSKISSVSAQASAPKLHSCDMMLADLPAAQPVIAAAENAVVNAHFVRSLAALKNAVQEVLLCDNALRSGALIMTMQVTGTKRAPIYSGAPPTYSLASLTVVMNYPSLTVTAVTRGGL